MAGSGASAGPPRLRRALFVDRDGTLGPDLHYLKEAPRLELFRGVGNALSLVHAHGELVVCVTNQSGVERGLYTVADVEAIHERLNELLRPFGSSVDAFYYCPHAPEHHCACRKPGTELFERARDELHLDLASSALIGDSAADIGAGARLGVLTTLVRSRGHEREVERDLAEAGLVPDLRAETFESAVLRVLARG